MDSGEADVDNGIQVQQISAYIPPRTVFEIENQGI